jgi:hypothetical protein
MAAGRSYWPIRNLTPPSAKPCGGVRASSKRQPTACSSTNRDIAHALNAAGRRLIMAISPAKVSTPTTGDLAVVPWHAIASGGIQRFHGDLLSYERRFEFALFWTVAVRASYASRPRASPTAASKAKPTFQQSCRLAGSRLFHPFFTASRSHCPQARFSQPRLSRRATRVQVLPRQEEVSGQLAA